jgi:hypothetical protein
MLNVEGNVQSQTASNHSEVGASRGRPRVEMKQSGSQLSSVNNNDLVAYVNSDGPHWNDNNALDVYVSIDVEAMS